MKKEADDTYLKPLEHLQEVEAPARLREKIRQAIAAREQEWVSPGKVALAGVAFCLLLLINTVVIVRSEPPRKGNDGGRNMGLFTDNELYK